MSVPWGGHSDPLKHNVGDNQSEFTSWTTDKSIALRFATKNLTPLCLSKKSCVKIWLHLQIILLNTRC